MKIAIIGGGAAGMLAAATILETSEYAEVLLFERNPVLGKKVAMTGGGRCNVTTGISDIRTALQKYPRGSKFLTSAMYTFPPNAACDWFTEHEVPVKVEADLRVFPQSDNGQDVVRVFERLLERSPRARLFLHSTVTGITKTNALNATPAFSIQLRGAAAPILADRVILTTGGQAYRLTGSTGDGYDFAQALGHRITPLAASLSSFTAQETWPKEVSGLSFARAELTAHTAPKSHFTGPILFTHRGITGPAVFALSSLTAFAPVSREQPLLVTINLFPEFSEEELHAQLAAAITANPRRTLANTLATLVPKSLADITCCKLQLSGDAPANEVPKRELLRAIHWYKSLPLHIIARGAGDEFVTAGGVALQEVDPRTMQSTICPGLFFAGEILDIDGFTGGFNLQAAWATGRLAGQAAAEEC